MLPIVLFLLIVGSAVFVYLAHRRRKVFALKEQEILEKQIAEVEKEGFEIPDEIKKVKTRIIKDADLRKSQQEAIDYELR